MSSETLLQIEEKLSAADRIIERWLRLSTRPLVAWSAGKDSMVLLWLVRRFNRQVPVMWIPQSWQEGKNEFAFRMIAEWDLKVHSPSPLTREPVARGGHVEIVEAYPAGGEGCFYLPLEGEPQLNPDKEFICAIERMNEPVGAENKFDYDVTFVGQRGEERDPLHGRLSLVGESAALGTTTLVYPLLNWTQGDIWEAGRLLNIPQNDDRYEAGTEKTDLSSNSDYHNLCTRCIEPGYDGRVIACPRGGAVFYYGDLIDLDRGREKWGNRLINIHLRKEETNHEQL